MKHRFLWVLFVIGCLCVSRAETPAEGFAWSGDVRYRREWTGNQPGAGGALTKGDNYDRLRTRLRLNYRSKNTTSYLSVANEWRYYYRRESRKRNYEFPNELTIDGLWWEYRGLWNSAWDIRVGRQDFQRGAGRVFADGRPLDGSCTFSMDMVLLTYHLSDHEKIEYFAAYNDGRTDLSIGRARGLPWYMDNVRPTAARYGDEYDAADTAAGFYATLGNPKDFRYELYGVYKHSSSSNRGYPAVRQPGRDVVMLGVRLLPVLSDQLCGELEVALQAGRTEDSRSVFAGMLYSQLGWRTCWNDSCNTRVYGAFYGLSGDQNEAEGAVHNWDPVFARCPQLNEVYTCTLSPRYGPGYWTNLLYPHIGAEGSLTDWATAELMVGPAFAAQADGLGGDDGQMLGWLGSAVLTVPLFGKGLYAPEGAPARGKGHVRFYFSYLAPGDYYRESDTAFFGRIELWFQF